MDPPYKVKYGPHFGGSAPSFDSIVEYCIENNWLTTQVFFGSPRSYSKRRELTKDEVKKTNILCVKYSFQVYTHFPYTMNLCKPQKRSQLVGLNKELLEMSLIGGRIIIHPNSPAVVGGEKNAVTKKVYIGGDGDKLKSGCCEQLSSKYGASYAKICEQWVAQCDNAIDVLVDNLNLLKFPQCDQKYQLLLEGCAFEGQKILGTFEQMEMISKRITNLPVGFCVDTCHAFASGMSKFDTTEAIDEFFSKLEKIGVISMVKAIHFNDSKDPFFSCKDNHAPIGQGCIWGNTDLEPTNIEPLKRLGHYCKLHKIDIICEVAAPSDFEICTKIF